MNKTTSPMLVLAAILLAGLASAQQPGLAENSSAGHAPDAVEGRLPDHLGKGLLLHWDFRTDEGGTVTDRSGNGHTGKVSNATWSGNGKAGGAYEFKGDGTIAADGFRQPDTGELSVSVWIRPSVDYGKDTGLRQITSHSWGTHQLRYIKGVLQVELYDPKHVVRQYSYPTALKAGQWHHVAFTAKAGGKVFLYVDGREVHAWDVDFKLEAPTKEFRVGNCVGNDRGFFVGAVGPVMVWDRALSAGEIKRLHALPRGGTEK